MLGFFCGVFATAVLVETGAVPAQYVKFLRSGAAVGSALTAVIGGWQVRRRQAESGAAPDRRGT
jgi:hypothetical protein